MKTLKTTAIAAALLSASIPANAATIATNADGWEISFGGTINLFYNTYESEAYNDIDGITSSAKEIHLQEGLLPAFATFKAKSPTINGLTGTAQISFAPDSSNSKLRRQDKGGSAIDMREVFFDVGGSFGTFSIGRTLGIFQRQAILKDQTLFGVGAGAAGDGSGTTLGRIGYGYVCPAFDTRFSYKTPDMNGLQLEVGLYDPYETASDLGGALPETELPRLETELTYGTNFGAGSVNAWGGLLWQEMDFGAAGDVKSFGWNLGAQLIFGGFEFVGSYYDGEALGVDLKTDGSAGKGTSAIGGAAGFTCAGFTGCEEADNDGFYAQLGYTFATKTKVAVGYGESNQDGKAGVFNDVSHELWTVGVYHDVNSWLKIVAEYNDSENNADNTSGSVDPTRLDGAFNPLLLGNEGSEAQVFSVGAFIFW